MKTLTTLITCFCLITFSAFSQNDLEVVVKENSNDANSKTERFHLLEVTNNTNSNQTVEVTSQNVKCSNVENNRHSDLLTSFYGQNRLTRMNTITLSPRESKEVYVKIYRPNNTKLNTWNCTEIVAKSISGNTSSNTLVIKSFIPDPKDFN